MTQVISVALDAISTSLVLALVAMGLAVVFGLVRVINMGHGAMLALGAYITWTLAQHGLPFFVSVIVSALLVGVIGLLFEVVLIRHFYDKQFETLLITWAFYLVATQLIKVFWGTDLHSVANPIRGTFTIGGAVIGRYVAVVSLVSLLLFASAGWVMYRTSVGIRVRAMIQNREMAMMLGVRASAMYRAIFALGAMLAGLAGGLISPMFSVEPDMGTLWLVRSFFVVTVGGLGSLVGGTLIGSALMGGMTTLVSLVAQQVFAQTVVFALAVIALRFRPAGILGKKAA
ncbi:branched-chain amino acid ABC transporter permease [Streptomyces fulvoviolaceus]|uniref:branched-chain amino acid ABC transporter permease n=1 Tax=Streptomyces fulvoviolaceus TaxID=285535 RepID=UPI0004CB8BF8|nr:branched-chain amino acid ABC transporter permease [Streptomyces fulvoviolaceus]